MTDNNNKNEQGVIPSIASRMEVNLLVSENSDVWVLHDKPLPEVIKWAEYDMAQDSFCFVTRDGRTQDLGMTVPDAMRNSMKSATEVTALLLIDKKIHDFYIVPLTVHGNTKNYGGV